jgi:hypothetical protein
MLDTDAEAHAPFDTWVTWNQYKRLILIYLRRYQSHDTECLVPNQNG